MKKNTRRYMLCNTMEIPTYEDYKMYCEDMEKTPGSEGSTDYWNWVSDMQSMEWEDLEINLKSSSVNDTPVIVVGSVGRWNGTFEIYPVRCETIWEAIQKCGDGASDIKVECQEGVIYVSAFHHDGSNDFEIHKLSKKGLAASNKWYEKIAPNKDYRDEWLAKFKGFLY